MKANYQKPFVKSTRTMLIHPVRILFTNCFSSTDNYCPFADLQYNGILLGLPKHVIIYKMERKSMKNFVKI